MQILEDAWLKATTYKWDEQQDIFVLFYTTYPGCGITVCTTAVMNPVCEQVWLDLPSYKGLTRWSGLHQPSQTPFLAPGPDRGVWNTETKTESSRASFI